MSIQNEKASRFSLALPLPLSLSLSLSHKKTIRRPNLESEFSFALAKV